MLNPIEKEILKYIIDDYALNHPVEGISAFLGEISASDLYARQLIINYVDKNKDVLLDKINILDLEKQKLQNKLDKLNMIGESGVSTFNG